MSVRYIVYDVDAAIDFYCGNLGFSEVMHPAPAFAMLARGDLRLVLSAAGGGTGDGVAVTFNFGDVTNNGFGLNKSGPGTLFLQRLQNANTNTGSSTRRGIYVGGSALGPEDIDSCISQGMSMAMRAIGDLNAMVQKAA